jgi:hypothetical protein
MKSRGILAGRVAHAGNEKCIDAYNILIINVIERDHLK